MSKVESKQNDRPQAGKLLESFDWAYDRMESRAVLPGAGGELPIPIAPCRPRIQLKGPPRELQAPACQAQVNCSSNRRAAITDCHWYCSNRCSNYTKNGPTKCEVTGSYWALREVNFHLFFDRFGTPGLAGMSTISPHVKAVR